MGWPTGNQMWRITKGCQLLWRRWDEEYVVYNSGSGHTHLLDAIGGGILRCLEEHPSNSQELAVEMAGESETDATPNIAARIEELLSRFQDLSLVEFIQR
jgi:PqqD family protein of HPr-rel-A system